MSLRITIVSPKTGGRNRVIVCYLITLHTRFNSCNKKTHAAALKCSSPGPDATYNQIYCSWSLSQCVCVMWGMQFHNFCTEYSQSRSVSSYQLYIYGPLLFLQQHPSAEYLLSEYCIRTITILFTQSPHCTKCGLQ